MKKENDSLKIQSVELKLSPLEMHGNGFNKFSNPTEEIEASLKLLAEMKI